MVDIRNTGIIIFRNFNLLVVQERKEDVDLENPGRGKSPKIKHTSPIYLSLPSHPVHNHNTVKSFRFALLLAAVIRNHGVLLPFREERMYLTSHC